MVTSSMRPPISAALPQNIEGLSAHYTFKDRAQIRQFLEANSLALTLLQEAPAHIARLFGAKTPVRLEISFDPEYPQQQELWAFILMDMDTPEKVLEAEQKLRRLHDEWLIHLPRALSGSVLFDVESE